MELRQVTIEEYWPLIVKNTAEFGQIAVAENPEFNNLAQCIYNALCDGFVLDATEYGVSRWESILAITPPDGATLDERKAAILNFLSIKLPYTVRVLRQMLIGLLGEGKVNIDFINDESKLIVHTDRVSDSQLQTVTELLERVLPRNLVIEQYNHHIEIPWRDIDKYAECVTVDDMLAVNPDYKNDLTSKGEWVYPLPNLQNAYYAFNESPMRKFAIELSSVTNATGMFKNTALEGEMTLSLPKVIFWSQIFDNGASSNNRRKLTKITLIGNPAVNAAIHQTFAQWGTRYDDYLEEVNIFGFTAQKMGADALCRNCRGLKRFRSDLVGQVIYWHSEALSSAQLDKESVLDIVRASYIGDTSTKNADWGIHVDLKNDDEVKAAIDSLKPYGWSISVRYNGTPTSGISTMDLEEIWCKLIESEYGEYTDENGTRVSLDWGHYVTDTTGYKLFFSLCEAEQYFKLTRIDNNE